MAKAKFRKGDKVWVSARIIGLSLPPYQTIRVTVNGYDFWCYPDAVIPRKLTKKEMGK